MKAIVVRRTGGPEVLTLEEVKDPAPRAHEVVIAVEACGVCFHDVVTRNGTLRAGIEFPFIPGHEVAGTVVAVGSAVSGIAIGDRVATTQRSFICSRCRYCRSEREPLCAEAVFMGDAGLNGGYAQYVATSAATIAPVPDGVGMADAAIAACAIGTVLHAVREIGKVRLGEPVLVTGAGGGLGLHAVQLARASNAVVIAQTMSEAKVPDIRAAGADHVVVGKDNETSAEIRALTGGLGVDVAIDTVGTPLFQLVRRSMARGGRWVLVGQVNGDFVPFNPAQLFLRGISLLSATSTTRTELIDVLALIDRGLVKPAVAECLPLAEAARAHALVESGAPVGRIVLRPAA